MVGQPPAPCPGRTCGDVGAPAPSPLPRQPAGTWRGTSSPGRRGGERGAAAWTPAKRRPRPGVDLVRATRGNLRPSRCRQARCGRRPPSRSPTTATPSNPLRQPWPVLAAPMDSESSAVRTARLQRPRTPDACPSGHPGHTGRVDTGRPGRRTRGHRTSTRPVGRRSVRTADSGGGQRNQRRGRRPDILDGHDDGDRPAGQPTLARVAAPAALGNPITAPR
jgi:hypothetical protein